MPREPRQGRVPQVTRVLDQGNSPLRASREKTHRHLLMAPMVDMGVSCNMALVLYPLAFKGARGFHASGVHGSFVLTSSTGVGGHWNFMLVIVRPMYARVF